MNVGLVKRFGFFFGGFAIGLVMLAFFLNGKKASCSYGPDSRVIKNIGLKQLIYSEASQGQIKTLTLDSSKVRQLIKRADINFSKSEARQKPCGLYVLESSIERKDYELTIENCSRKALLVKVEAVE